jgi:succinate-acetate transporter protein
MLMMILGTLFAFGGLAFLIAGAVTYRLSKAWA